MEGEPFNKVFIALFLYFEYFELTPYKESDQIGFSGLLDFFFIVSMFFWKDSISF